MLTITALCLLLGAHVERVRRHREAISMVKSVGGWIESENDGALYDEFCPAITYVDVSDSEWIPSHFGIVSLQVEHVRWFGASERFEVCTPRRLRQILARLVDAPRLSTLRLDSTCATDCDMPIVAQIGQLEVLDLQNTSISDTGLKCFSGLRKLRQLYLYDSKVTRRGVDALRLCLPDCEVFWVPAKRESRLVWRRQP
jgi:hypothetical protein